MSRISKLRAGDDRQLLLMALAVLALSSLVAALLPARRAATMNPVRALRME
jgi:ABC-type lipoprotein release transport system permease subunit